MVRVALLAVVSLAFASTAFAEEAEELTPVLDRARAFIVSPKDGNAGSNPLITDIAEEEVLEEEEEERTPAPESARVYIVSPKDGEAVSNPFTVVFGLTDMGVAPAGVERMDTGHHHLLINAAIPYLDEPIPANDNFLHFGGGQTEVLLELPPGRHYLQLLMSDLYHTPHDPPVFSDIITIYVK